MTCARAVIRVEDDIERVVDRLDRQGIEAHQFSHVAFSVLLDLERGDEATAKKDGSVRIVQDALPVQVADAEIVAITD